MPFWEYEYFTKFANELLEEEKKGQEDENEEYSMDSIKKNANSMMRSAYSGAPKMPNYGSMKMPSFSMPKI